MTLGLVLGGGGLIGMGYHAGALAALADFGIDVHKADLMVGTSAGSIMTSYLRNGWSQMDFFEYAHGRHRDVSKDNPSSAEQVREIFTPMYSSRGEQIRRGVGGFFALVASRGYWQRSPGKGRTPAGLARKAFPSGMYSTEQTRQRLEEDLPVEWPDRDLFICAVDLYSGERVPFGHPDAPPATQPEAVLASTSIPGVFPPVQIGDRQYVDGGAASATSLDLATEYGCDTIICIAPLGYRSDAPFNLRDTAILGPMMIRSLFARALRREVTQARERGVNVFVIRPWLTDLKEHGTNSMRDFDRQALTIGARMGTLRLLEEQADHPALQAWMDSDKQKRKGGISA
jgi:NTE family protein